jgi:hypothetical protein
MKGNSYVVACMAASITVAPLCAHRLRPPTLAHITSTEAFLANIIRTGQGGKLLLWATIACAVFGFVVGLFGREQIGPVPPRKEFEPCILRLPPVVFLLVPTALAAFALIFINWTPKVADGIVWPDRIYLYFAIPIVIAIGYLSSTAAQMFNYYECNYEKVKPEERLGVCPWWPLAFLFGGLVTFGAVAIGLLLGAYIGTQQGCPLLDTWLGTGGAAFVVAFFNDIFWPAYYPMTRLSTT